MEKTKEMFDQRVIKKKIIEFTYGKKKADIGEFWRYREGVNIGNEISKDGVFKRVCLVLNNNLGNGLFFIAPITTKYHEWMDKYYIKINNYEKYSLKESRIIINQIKLIDGKRFERKLGDQSSLKLANITRIKFYDMFL